MTLAPKSANVCVQAGRATTRVKSTTSRPSRAVGAPSFLGERSGNCGPAVMISRPFPGHWCGVTTAPADFTVYFRRFTSSASALPSCRRANTTGPGRGGPSPKQWQQVIMHPALVFDITRQISCEESFLVEQSPDQRRNDRHHDQYTPP